MVPTTPVSQVFQVVTEAAIWNSSVLECMGTGGVLLRIAPSMPGTASWVIALAMSTDTVAGRRKVCRFAV